MLFLPDSEKTSLHDLALLARKDKSISPFQHDIQKFCKQPSTYHLLSIQYGLSQTKTYSGAVTREREGLELLFGGVPEKYCRQLFPMWKHYSEGIHETNQGISVYTWVAAAGDGKRDQLARFLTQHGLISLINTTWECHEEKGKSNNNNKVAREISSSLLYLPNILELEKHQIVYMARVLTNWCKQQEMAELKKQDQSKQPYTMKEVSPHNTASDLWTVIDGQVYDLSGFSDLHPGGSIIMNAAGTDGTVLFHQYHLHNPESAKLVLTKYHIGCLEDKTHTSPKMGLFYETVALRVKDTLKNVPRHPTAAKVSWALDASLMTFFAALACFVRTDWPMWTLILIHFAIPNISSLRMEGQQHANGHIQIFGPGLSWWAELYGYLLGVPAMFSYGFPSPQKNARCILHQSRKQAQFEFPEGRGFAEHMALHHVKGAALEHDQCFKLVSVMGILCLSAKQPVLMPLVQEYQHRFWFQAVLDIIVEAADCTKLPFIVPRLRYVFEYLLSSGEYVRGVAILLGTFSSMAVSWCYLALIFSGYNGFICFVCLGILKEYIGMFGVQVFFGQHVWDNPTEERLADSDWGRYNAESCYSWWGRGRCDMWLYPFLWGTSTDKGCSCPSTLTYHLEHTLFPGVNYLHLPKIASTVRSACNEFGIKYNCLASSRDLLKERQDKLRLYSLVSGTKRA